MSTETRKLCVTAGDEKHEHQKLLPDAAPRKQCRMSTDKLPFCPSGEMVFNYLFFRKLFTKLEQQGLAKNGKVHYFVLRNVSVRLMDAVGLNGVEEHSRSGFFVREPKHHDIWYSWKDLLTELREYGHPSAPIFLAERIFLTLEQPESSRLAKIVSVLVMLVILMNLVVVVLQSFDQDDCNELMPWGLEFGRQCGSGLQNIFVLIFSAEYFIRLVCCPWVRPEVLNYELLLNDAIPNTNPRDFGEKEGRTKFERVFFFLFAPANIIDLISILPWWITHLAVALPAGSTSFLRVVRIFRIVRIFKTGRYVQNLQVLGVVLGASGRSISILMLFISMVALVGGVLLSNFEEAFSNIPMAVYWTFAQLIALKNTDFVGNKVVTPTGIFIAACIVSLKAVLWILPIGQIKAAFDSADSDMKHMQNQCDTMEYELTKPSWASWYGLSHSVRIHLVFYEIEPGGKVASKPYVRSSMPVPILETHGISHILDVPIPAMKEWWQEIVSGESAIALEMLWSPSEDMKEAPKPAMPAGKLSLRILQGKCFPKGDSTRWRICVNLPVGLSSDAAMNSQETSSQSGGTAPLFGGELSFDVDWASAGCRAPESPSPEASPHSASRFSPGGKRDMLQPMLAADNFDTNDFQRAVLGLLQAQNEQLAEQSYRLQALERQLAAARHASTIAE